MQGLICRRRRRAGLPRHRPRDQGRDAGHPSARVPPAGCLGPRRPRRARTRRRTRGAPRRRCRHRAGHRREGAERARARPRRAGRPRDRPLGRGDHGRSSRRPPLDERALLRARRDRRRAHRAPAPAPRHPGRDARIHRVRADPAARSRRRRAARRRPGRDRRAPGDGRRLAPHAERQHPAHPDPVDPRRSRGRGDPAAVRRRRPGRHPARRPRAARGRHRARARTAVGGCRAHRRAPVPAVPPAHHRLPGAGRPAGDRDARRGRDRRGRVRRARHGHRTAPGGPRRLRRARAGGLRRRNLARQHLPGRRVRRAQRTSTASPTHPNPLVVGHVCARATRSGRTSSASSTRRSSAIGCGCVRAMRWRRLGCRGRGVAHRDRRPRRRGFHRRHRDDVIVADVLVLACGRLTEPSIPEIAGLETLPRAAVPLGRAGTTPPTSRAPGGGRRHGGERGAARARARADGGTRHALPAHARVDRAAGRRRATPTPTAPRFAGDPQGSRRCAPTCTPRARRASRRDPATPRHAAAEAEAVARAHLERAGRRPRAARRAHPGLRVRLQARAALGRLLPGRRVGRRDARQASALAPSTARRSSPSDGSPSRGRRARARDRLRLDPPALRRARRAARAA